MCWKKGSLFLAGGIARFASAFQSDDGRFLLVLNAALTTLLGLLILFQWPVSAMWLIGTLIAVQFLLEGLTMVFIGRLRPVEQSMTTA